MQFLDVRQIFFLVAMEVTSMGESGILSLAKEVQHQSKMLTTHISHSMFAHPTTRALIRVVGESSSTSMGNSVLASSSESRALIGSSTGLAERETSNCGTVNLSLLACGSETGDIPSSTRESRLRGSFCRKPSSLPTRSMLLKYY
jgi:hypothetical protein